MGLYSTQNLVNYFLGSSVGADFRI